MKYIIFILNGLIIFIQIINIFDSAIVYKLL